MKSSLIILLLFVFFFSSCHDQQQVKANIFERRELQNNRLLIKYQYLVGNKTYTDSATIANVVFNADSIAVIINPANPGKSIPVITK